MYILLLLLASYLFADMLQYRNDMVLKYSLKALIDEHPDYFKDSHIKRVFQFHKWKYEQFYREIK